VIELNVLSRVQIRTIRILIVKLVTAKFLRVSIELLASNRKGILSPNSCCIQILILSPNVFPQQIIGAQDSLGS
jgi:hypothetical protein